MVGDRGVAASPGPGEASPANVRPALPDTREGRDGFLVPDPEAHRRVAGVRNRPRGDGLAVLAEQRDRPRRRQPDELHG